MLLGLVLLPCYIFLQLGSVDDIHRQLQLLDPGLVNIWGTGGLTAINIATILGYAMIGLGFMGSPQVFVRFMSIKSVSEIKKGRWVALIFTLLTDAAAVTIGIMGRYLFTKHGQDVEVLFGNGAQDVLPYMVEMLLPALLAAVYIAVVLAAIMSTIDSLLIVASSAITRDFDQKVFKKQRQDHTNFSRKVTLAMAIVALVVALTISVLSPSRTIFWFVIFGWSGIAATFCPMMILSLFWKNYNEPGAIASMITGFICVPLFKFGATSLPVAGVYFEQVAELLPSFLLSLILGIVVSKLSSRGSKAPDQGTATNGGTTKFT